MIQLNNGNKKILQIAIPSIVSNITVPLLGLIDVTIVGHLGSAAYIGAIAVGGMLFNIIYWIFGFLRMGTSGMTSQAYGRHDLNEVTRLLLRSVGVGLFIAFTLLALQYPIERTAFTFIQTTEEVEHLASLYFYICIWGAPAVLGLYSFAGWYIGMQNSRFPMYIAITQNIVNIAVSLLLVYGLGMKIEGVAIGTLTAQYAGLVMAYLLWLRYYSTLRKRIEWHSFFDKQAMYRFFQVNRDIFFRTICLVAVTVFFTSAMLLYPDFFKVAVSCAGNHDNNIYNRWWGEKHHGVKEITDDMGNISFDIRIPTNQELARNLKGHLLLIHGDIDNNVHPANTIVVVDELIKAGKRFDMLIVPGKRHHFDDYNEYYYWRMVDYFSEYLRGERETGADIKDLKLGNWFQGYQ